MLHRGCMGEGGRVVKSTAPLWPLFLPGVNQIFGSSVPYELKPSFPLTK